MSDLIPATADELLAKIDQAAQEQEPYHGQAAAEAESRDWVTAVLLCLTGLVVVAVWVAVLWLLVAL